MGNLSKFPITINDMKSEQEQALEMLFLSVKDRMNCDFQTFVDAIKSWEIVPLSQKNEVIGAVMTKENEIHVGYGKKPCGSILKHIKNTLLKIIKKYGFAVTIVSSANQKGLEFCKRLGFVEIKQDNDKIYMKCERCKYAAT